MVMHFNNGINENITLKLLLENVLCVHMWVASEETGTQNELGTY